MARQRQLPLLLFLAIWFVIGTLVYLECSFVFGQFGSTTAHNILRWLLVMVVSLTLLGLGVAAVAHGIMRGQLSVLKNPPPPGSRVEPFVLRLYGHILFQYPGEPFVFEVLPPADTNEPYHIDPLLRRNRPQKASKYSYEERKRVVLMWENRDPSLYPLTLEEFLAREFGTAPGGVLNVAPSTFYTWRAKILKELDSKKGRGERKSPSNQ